MPRNRYQSVGDFKGDMKALVKFMEKDLPDVGSKIALDFFKDSWRRSGFIDKKMEKWKPSRGRRDDKKRGKGVLVESGRLKKSLRRRVNKNSFTIYTNVPYAEIHNEGGKISKKVNVRKHQRRVGRKRKTVKAHTRNMNLTIPKRQFMGESKLLEKRMVAIVARQLNNFKL